MGCTPPARRNATVPPVNAHPHPAPDHPRAPSIEEIINNEPMASWKRLRELDFATSVESGVVVEVGKMDFERKRAVF